VAKKRCLYLSALTLMLVATAAGCDTVSTLGVSDAGAGAVADADADRPIIDAPQTPSGEGGPPPRDCYSPENASGYDPAKNVVAAQPGACTAEAVAEGLRACTGVTANVDGCEAFKAGNLRCAGCLGLGSFNKDDAGKAILPAVLHRLDDGIYPNKEACVSVVLHNEAACGMAYVNQTICLLSACETCTTESSTCAARASEDVCEGAVVDPKGACGKAYLQGLAARSACQASDGPGTLAKVAAVLCE